MMGGMMGQGMMDSGMMQMMGKGMGMMATGGPGPSMILRMGDALGLTEDQRIRLQAIQEEHSGSTTGHMRSAMAAHQEAAEALRSDSPDFEAYEDALREAANHMVLAHTGMARAASEAREVLDAEQRGQLQRMMERMMERPGRGAGGRPR